MCTGPQPVKTLWQYLKGLLKPQTNEVKKKKKRTFLNREIVRYYRSEIWR